MLQPLKDQINHTLFLWNGKKPWSRGYNVYRQRQISQILEGRNFQPRQLPPGYGYRLDERVVEYPWLFSQLPVGGGKLLDAGSALNFSYLLNREPLRSKRIYICTLAPEPDCFYQQGISYLYEDLRQMSFRDACFDWVVSISTLEHIGLDNTRLYTHDPANRENDPDAYLTAVQEYRRVLRPSGCLYLSFPFGRAVNHGWFQVFNSAMVDRVIAQFSPTTVEEFYFHYQPQGWQAASRDASQEATYFDIHQRQSYDPDYAAASRAIACLKLVK